MSVFSTSLICFYSTFTFHKTIRNAFHIYGAYCIYALYFRKKSWGALEVSYIVTTTFLRKQASFSTVYVVIAHTWPQDVHNSKTWPYYVDDALLCHAVWQLQCSTGCNWKLTPSHTLINVCRVEYFYHMEDNRRSSAYIPHCERQRPPSYFLLHAWQIRTLRYLSKYLLIHLWLLTYACTTGDAIRMDLIID